MKSKLILAFVVLLVIAFVGCDTGNNSETTLQPRPKYLKITGVPVGKKSVWVGLNGGKDSPMIVQGYASLTDNKTTVNISLKSYEDREDCWRDSPNWTGTGAYYLFLTIDNMDGTSEPQYFYSAGQPILSNMSSGVKKYNFNDEYPTTTVDLSQFAIPGDWLRNSYSYTTEVTISPGEYYITIVQEEGQTKSVEFISANNSAIGSSKFGDY